MLLLPARGSRRRTVLYCRLRHDSDAMLAHSRTTAAICSTLVGRTTANALRDSGGASP